MRFTLTFDTDNDAFGDGDTRVRTQAIRDTIAAAHKSIGQLAGGLLPGESLHVRDANGNTIGLAALSED